MSPTFLNVKRETILKMKKLFLIPILLLACGCNDYDDFSFTGKVVDYEMCDGLLPYCREHGINTKLLDYVRMNTYVYIGYKLSRAENTDGELKKEIDQYIKKHPINMLNFGKYDWKKYLVYRVLIGI